ncbi:MAG: hypothetical protein SP4CHLAM5_01420 [Chlamydiia bacterium]|nr:hypothetical protein [Chlamydiia bacterium]MCH9618017.1 hypothetical protein [Chlamydiia bacterium]MCH9623658.1 hypothetical protein [Chlamydiia bacterium]
MKFPLFPQQNYAMHLVAASLVELFPNFQLLDLSVYPDRSCIDFSFARELSLEELKLAKGRFFEKLKRGDRGDIREMVSKNACDLLKHYKQIFLTELVDREEMFTEMLCMDVYNAPLSGEIDQGKSSIAELKLDMYDLGEKKVMKRKVHHYRLDVFTFFSKADRSAWESLDWSRDHLELGSKEKLFWVEDGLKSFSKKGECEFEKLISNAANFFGDKVYFDGEVEDFYSLSKCKEFFACEETEGNYDGICYGLKETELSRSITAWSFSSKKLNEKLVEFVTSLGLSGFYDDQNRYHIYDYRGVPWVIAELIDNSKYLTLEINLQCLFALQLEKKGK